MFAACCLHIVMLPQQPLSGTCVQVQRRLEDTRKARRQLLAEFTEAQLKLEQDFLMQKAVRLTKLNEKLRALDAQVRSHQNARGVEMATFAVKRISMHDTPELHHAAQQGVAVRDSPTFRGQLRRMWQSAVAAQDATSLQALAVSALAAAVPALAEKPPSWRPPPGPRLLPLALPRSPCDGQTHNVPNARATAASPAARRPAAAAAAPLFQKPQASAGRGGRPKCRSSSDSGSDHQQQQLQRSLDDAQRGVFHRTDKLQSMHDILQTSAGGSAGSGWVAERPLPETLHEHAQPNVSPPDHSQDDLVSPSSSPPSSPSISAATAAAIAAAAASSGFSDSSGGSDDDEYSYSSLDGEASPTWRSRNAKSAAAPTRRSSRVAGKSPVVARQRRQTLGQDALGGDRRHTAPNPAAADAEAVADAEPTADSPCKADAGEPEPGGPDTNHSSLPVPATMRSRGAGDSRRAARRGGSASAKRASSSSSLRRQVTLVLLCDPGRPKSQSHRQGRSMHRASIVIKAGPADTKH